MAIRKLPSGNFQARVHAANGRVLSETFATRLEAQEQVLKWKKEKAKGVLHGSSVKCRTVDEFFREWFQELVQETSEAHRSGWRELQFQQYRDYVQPVLGPSKLKAVTPQMAKRVLNNMAQTGRAPQTQRHVYVLMRKMFGDAVENYQYLTFNPVLRKLAPAVPIREAKHLNLDQMKALLSHVEDKKYGLAVWLQIFLGLRCGELQGLHWEDVDLASGRVCIRRTYVRKLGVLRDYPKGKKQHSHSIPKELLAKLRVEKLKATSPLVVNSPKGGVMPHRWYLVALKKYCHEIGIPEIASHGLRHSTSELYLSHGATRDDLRQLFAHSSLLVTDRYVHDRGSRLEQVSNVISIFGNEMTTKIDHAAVLDA